MDELINSLNDLLAYHRRLKALLKATDADIMRISERLGDTPLGYCHGCKMYYLPGTDHTCHPVDTGE